MPNPLMDEDREALEVILARFRRSFALSSIERRRLHEVEWVSDDDSKTIRAEIDVFSDFVAGVGETLLKRGWSVETRSLILGQPLYGSDKFHAWLKENAPRYPHLAAYVRAAEYLCSFYIEIISSSTEDIEPARRT